MATRGQSPPVCFLQKAGELSGPEGNNGAAGPWLGPASAAGLLLGSRRGWDAGQKPTWAPDPTRPPRAFRLSLPAGPVLSLPSHSPFLEHQLEWPSNLLWAH